MEFTNERGEQRYAALVRALPDVVVGLDFDGTLAPIVEDPESAHIHPDAAEALLGLAGEVLAVAVITGRPARQVLDLGGLEELGRGFAERGKELHVFGQYGHERWTSSSTRVVSPTPPAGLAAFERELPRVLSRHDAAEAWVEEKGLAVAVHTRRLEAARETFDRLLPDLTSLARAHDLTVEPGRNVIEVRSPGVHKGQAVDQLVDELGARGFGFAGDDLGDREAFEALGRLEERGLTTLRVCSASDEENALLPYADVVVHGPDGVMDLLRRLTADAVARRR